MCHHRESSPEWEVLVEQELRSETEPDAESEESPDELGPRPADD